MTREYNYDKYRTGNYKIRINCLVRALNPHSNSKLTKFYPLDFYNKISISLSENKEYVKMIMDSLIKEEFNKFLKEEIRNNIKLKEKIGGIRWDVEYIDERVRIYKDRVIY